MLKTKFRLPENRVKQAESQSGAARSLCELIGSHFLLFALSGSGTCTFIWLHYTLDIKTSSFFLFRAPLTCWEGDQPERRCQSHPDLMILDCDGNAILIKSPPDSLGSRRSDGAFIALPLDFIFFFLCFAGRMWNLLLLLLANICHVFSHPPVRNLWAQ